MVSRVHAPHLEAASKHQLLYFDAIRGLSAQMVVVGHSMNIFLPAFFMIERANGTFRTTTGVFYMQNFGVMLFFVLSGYLVSRSALTKMVNPAYTFGEYFLERFARVFVPFVPAVILVALFDRLVLRGHGSPFTAIPLDAWTTFANLTMLYNNPVLSRLAGITGLPLGAHPIGTANPFWSVVIEWWIYMVFGLLVIRVVRDRRLGPFGLAVLAFAGLVVLQAVVGHPGLILAWLVGMAFAIGRPRALFAHRILHRIIGVLALVAIPLLLRRSGWNVYTEAVALAISLAVMSLYAGFSPNSSSVPANQPPRPEMSSAPMAEIRTHSRVGTPGRVAASLRTVVKYVSDYSYSLYLVHFSVLIYLQTVPSLRDHPRLTIPLAFVLANALALTYWALIERHYPRVRRALRRTRVWQVLSPTPRVAEVPSRTYS